MSGVDLGKECRKKKSLISSICSSVETLFYSMMQVMNESKKLVKQKRQHIRYHCLDNWIWILKWMIQNGLWLKANPSVRAHGPNNKCNCHSNTEDLDCTLPIWLMCALPDPKFALNTSCHVADLETNNGSKMPMIKCSRYWNNLMIF